MPTSGVFPTAPRMSSALTGWIIPARARPPGSQLQLVAEAAEQLFALGDVGVGLHAERARAVHDTQDRPALLGLAHDDLDPVGRGAEDAADLPNHLHRVQDVDGESIAKETDE